MRDLGVPSHVLRLRPMPLGTLLRVELGFGALLAAAVVLGAPAIVLGFHAPTPGMVAAVQVMTLFMLLEGVSAVALIWFESNLRIERTLSAEILRTATYCVTVLFAAAAGWSFWSGVSATIASRFFEPSTPPMPPRPQ